MPKMLLIGIAALLLVVGAPAGTLHAVEELPALVRLEGLRPVYQLFNRCAAAALTIQLSYYGWPGTYDDAIRSLNPGEDDVAVRLDEMVAFAQTQGLLAIERFGGTNNLMKALLAAGFPVLVEHVYYDGPNYAYDWMSHNRVLMGYDDAQQVFLSFDSLLGNGPDNTGRPIPYADIDDRWRPFNRAYMVVYRPEDEPLLIATMGEFWDETYAKEHALAQSQGELDAGGFDSFTLFNMGWSLTLLGRHEEAADFFDRARGNGLPWRKMWYTYEPLEAYYNVGRYDDVLSIVRTTITDAPGVEEMYYYAGLVYEAQGNMDRARSNYQAALFRNRFYTAARDALTRVGG